MTNFIKFQHLVRLNIRSEEIGNTHDALLLHTEVGCLSPGKAFAQLSGKQVVHFSLNTILL